MGEIVNRAIFARFRRFGDEGEWRGLEGTQFGLHLSARERPNVPAGGELVFDDLSIYMG